MSAVVVSTATGAAAATGKLPDPAQDLAADLLELIGIHVPARRPTVDLPTDPGSSGAEPWSPATAPVARRSPRRRGPDRWRRRPVAIWWSGPVALVRMRRAIRVPSSTTRLQAGVAGMPRRRQTTSRLSSPRGSTLRLVGRRTYRRRRPEMPAGRSAAVDAGGPPPTTPVSPPDVPAVRRGCARGPPPSTPMGRGGGWSAGGCAGRSAVVETRWSAAGRRRCPPAGVARGGPPPSLPGGPPVQPPGPPEAPPAGPSTSVISDPPPGVPSGLPLVVPGHRRRPAPERSAPHPSAEVREFRPSALGW